MTALLAFGVYGAPAPQGSKAKGRHGNLYEMSRHLPAWRERVTHTARIAQGPLWEPLNIPVVVRAEFYLPRPPSTKFTNHPAGPPDLDKLFRAVGDCLTKAGTITDDSRIVRWLGTKHWAIGRNPGAEISIYEMEQNMTDLNDARVEAFSLARSCGLGTVEFNQLWRIIVPAAINAGKRKQ